ncbi:HAD family hydrolase [Spirochaeta lutea]|uniref:5' nucleotidase, deoxy (Pyrimidine), cytosolic type C protein (NT5C) n=1 Tax=Spirochaeta lutea TaxID=1480694 RepID=A0A098QU60_9SPIO|nr:hypothetical protein [Spirochaeta lutea]KGE71360.1 hypothetical protein DC28_11150 [Spirochaeta lutea]
MTSLQLFLDLDGVLADFDGGVKAVTGRLPEALPPGVMWGKIAKTPDFYNTLDWMPDGQLLWEHLHALNPIILTGLPRGSWAEPQKRAWCKRMLGPDIEVITCMSREKATIARERVGHDRDMVLVDDRERLRGAWEDAGGIFIHHRNARESLQALQPYLVGENP